MRAVFGYGLLVAIGLAVGVALAIQQVRQGLSSGGIANGPWHTPENAGTARADIGTRAVVALRGLLALPESEAVYFNAANDSDGRALQGSCSYRVMGGAIPTRWWTLTAYDAEGYLIANPDHRYSVGSSAMTPLEKRNWTVSIGPKPPLTDGSRWIATENGAPFELTLRAYHPKPALLADRAHVALPKIVREGCPS